MIQNSLSDEQNGLKMIHLDEVGDKLNLRDRNAIRKWLRSEAIGLHKMGKKFLVYEIELDYALAKPYVMSLRRKFPNKWQQLYKFVCKDQSLYDYTLFLMEEEPELMQLTKVVPQSREDKKLLNQLLQ